MGKRWADRRDDDDYFAEPNYDDFTDEELDELYHYGEVRSPRKQNKVKRKKSTGTSSPELFAEDEEDWLDFEPDDDVLTDSD